MRILFLLVLMLGLGRSVMLAASPRAYALQPDQSIVRFETDFGADLIAGTMPVAAASVTLDFDILGDSSLVVDVNARQAQASFPFATQALTGPDILDTGQFPILHFASTGLTRLDQGAALDGQITVRGVTRPIRFIARIHRQEGTAEGDIGALVVVLTGSLRRSDFGATGWADMVGDEVRLHITASLVSTD